MTPSRRSLNIFCCFLPFFSLSCVLAEENLELAFDAFSKPRQGSFRIAKDGGPDGGPVLRARSVAPDWNGLLTRSFGVPAETVSMDFRGKMMTEKVVGSGQSFTSARAQLVFLNSRGVMLGKWPESTDLSGTTAWKEFHQTHKVPLGTAYVTVNLGLYNAVGMVQYAGLSLIAKDAAGKKLLLGPPPSPEATDTSKWRAFEAPPFRADSSPLLDVPKILGQTDAAGGHGVLGVKGGGFVFADGTPVRFWGTNFGVADNWRAEPESAAAVERVRRLGFNMVRLHHLDAGWAKESLFDETKNTTQEFQPQRLDNFFRMLGQLRKAGIYYYLDLLVTRKFKAGDGVRDADTLEFGAKIAGHFNRRLIDLQKDYARKLLTTLNPHTGLKLADDPALALVGIINESSLFLQGAVGSYEQLPKSYIEELDGLFAAWRSAKGLPEAKSSVPALLKNQDPQTVQFLMETQDAYYAEMRAFLRDELGVKVPIIGSNFQEVVADALSNAKLDVYDVHVYWDHPQGGWSADAPMRNTPLVESMTERGSPFHKIAAQRIAGMPLFVSEWQTCWPNETQFEGPLLFSTMASLQGWDGLAFFGLSEAGWSEKMTGVFAAGQRPNTTIASAAAALIFRRGDIARLPVKKIPLGKDLMEVPGADLPDDLLLSDAVEVVLSGTPTEESPAPEAGGAAGEVSRDSAGFLRIQAPRIAAVLGATGGRPVAAGGVEFQIKTPFVQALALSLTSDPLAVSSRVLVQAVARVENTGTLYRPFRKGVLDLGKAPILIEPVIGTVSWTVPQGSSPVLIPLDWNGDAGEPRTLALDAAGRVTVDLSTLPAGSAVIQLSPSNQPTTTNTNP